MADVHVVPSGERWALEVDGEQRDTFPTQSEAIVRGRGLADGEGGDLVIHGEDGQIPQKDSHGDDPRETPG